MQYILFKKPIQYDRYLHSLGLNLVPQYCVECNYPTYVTSLPTILFNKELYIGFDNCVKFYEKISGVNDLINKANKFKENNPNYKIKK